MTTLKPNSDSHAHRPITPVAMAASIVVGIAGGGLVSVNPAQARLPNSIPLTTSVVPSLGMDTANLRSPAVLLLASSLVTSDVLVPQAGPVDPIRGFWRWFFRFFAPQDPI